VSKSQDTVKSLLSRRDFVAASALGTGTATSALTGPSAAAARAVGIRPRDLPDLTIKEVKVYATDLGGRQRLNSTDRGEVASVVTQSGIEGFYSLGNRGGTGTEWLDYAKRRLLGKSVLDHLGLTPRYMGGPTQNWHASAVDICLWDILGKTVGLPVYRLLGAYQERIPAYASSNYHNTVEEYVVDLERCKTAGYRGYKIHPPGVRAAWGRNIAGYQVDMEVIRAVRKAAGDDFVLMHDPVQRYTRYEALEVGRLLDQLNYLWFEDPIHTTDIAGLAELCRALDLQVHVGEFIFSANDFPIYIMAEALTVVRFIADNVGGIAGGMRVGQVGECWGMQCAPHNWGNVFDLAVHFHCELAMPNCYWFEMGLPEEATDVPYVKERFRINKEGYMVAPTKPGLGLEIDRDILDKMTRKVEM
jgi:L-alanine-DL-glutamate epimerase-like enolase superfamily enzyme